MDSWWERHAPRLGPLETFNRDLTHTLESLEAFHELLQTRRTELEQEPLRAPLAAKYAAKLQAGREFGAKSLERLAGLLRDVHAAARLPRPLGAIPLPSSEHQALIDRAHQAMQDAPAIFAGIRGHAVMHTALLLRSPRQVQDDVGAAAARKFQQGHPTRSSRGGKAKRDILTEEAKPILEDLHRTGVRGWEEMERELPEAWWKADKKKGEVRKYQDRLKTPARVEALKEHLADLERVRKGGVPRSAQGISRGAQGTP